MKYLLLSLLVLAGCGTTDPVPQYNTQTYMSMIQQCMYWWVK